jgi:hypothetical protein
MSDQRFIDDALRRVNLPENLGAGLQPESLFADAAIDRLLASVRVPGSLEESIRASVRSQPTRHQNGAIDLSRFVAGGSFDPASPLPTPRHRSGFPSVLRDMVSVLAALGLIIVVAVTGIELSRRLEGSPRASRVATRLDFTEPTDASAAEWPLRFDVPDGMASFGDPSPAPRPSPLPSADGEVAHTHMTPRDTPESGTLATVDDRPSTMTVVRGATVPPPPASRWDRPPFMATVDVPGLAHRTVPRTRGYDLAFEMTTGEAPFVDPASDPILAVNRPPLSLGTHDFERLTAARDVSHPRLRAEDILAVVSPPPAILPMPQAIGLHVHEVSGLRSLGNTRTVLLEVAVTAGPVPPATRPDHFTLVLDPSAAGDPAIWRRICRAVADLTKQLAADERVSVVLCGPRPRLALDRGDGRALAALAADLQWQPALPSADLEAGLRLAPPSDRTVVVAHATSLDAPGAHVGEALAAWHKGLATVGGDTLACRPAGGTRFIVLDPGARSPAEPAEPTFGRTASDTVSIRRELIRQVTGIDTLVARSCSLEVRFDPRRVARYRLIGHRQSAVESLADGTPRGCDLHAGETVRAVYEVVPRVPGAGPGFASAAISWTASSGDHKRLESGPNRSDVDLREGLPSPHGCELVLAASLGELLSASAHVTRRPALSSGVSQFIEAWRRRGDVTATGDALARIHDRHVNALRKAL